MSDSLEKRVRELGRRILERTREEERALSSRQRAESALLEWCMKDPELKTKIFRFIDVYPALKTPKSVLQHIREYFPDSGSRLPGMLRAALFFTRSPAISTRTVAHMTDKIYRRMAALFIGAEDAREAVARLKEFDEKGCTVSIDLLGEKTVSESEAHEYEERYESLIHSLGALRYGYGRQNVSVKLSALDPRFSAIDPEGTSLRVRDRLSRLAKAAREQNVFLHIDMEDYVSRDLTLRIIRDLLQENAFSAGLHVGLVLQAYLKDAEETYEKIKDWTMDFPVPVTVRLVRGAYWDTEIMQAQHYHWPVPVFEQKAETDRMFERLVSRMLREKTNLNLAVATHNVRSLAYSLAVAEETSPAKDRLEFQILYGMGAPFIPALQEAGHIPRIYMPIGHPVRGMAYLVRRLLENVSSQSFVRQGFHDPAGEAELLKKPVAKEMPGTSASDKTELGESSYIPAARLQFHRRAIRQRFQKAIDTAPKGFGEEIPLVIGGEPQKRTMAIESMAPSDGKTVLARISMATPDDVRDAVKAAAAGKAEWAETAVGRRSECLRKAARQMTERRFELAALEVYEVGKTWAEADADIVEAIDFLNYYAWAAERLMRERTTETLVQEINLSRPHPRGVAAAIAPWNFPVAILTGMTSAALVTGNPVLMKPAEQSPVCAWRVFSILRKAGIPPGALHFLPGLGEEIGPVLVEHPDVAVIAFTGSREVGLQILEAANRPQDHAKLVKKCIVEMGGKNAAIVDESADFDQTLPAVLESAFAFAGQKCSALSRLIVVDSIYDDFVRRLVESAESYCVDDPVLPETRVGPVIDPDAVKKNEAFLDRGRRDGRLLYQARLPRKLSGCYIPPSIFGDLPPASPLLNEEIFGPVLSVIRVKDFREALQEANKTGYALTGGLFSRTPAHIEEAKKHFEAGNFYVNRSITGAVVGRQPFGGYRLSGDGVKAGCEDYLREFYISRTITEDVSRHGFAPMPEDRSSGKRLDK